MVIATWIEDKDDKCNSRWQLIIDGVDVSDYIPRELLHNSMDTEISVVFLPSYYYDDTYTDFYEHMEGMIDVEWVEYNYPWLEDICGDDEELMYSIYRSFNMVERKLNRVRGGCNDNIL